MHRKPEPPPPDPTARSKSAAGPEPARGGRATLGHPVFVLGREAVRAVDRQAVERFGLPSIVLMENAAGGLSNCVIDALKTVGADSALIVCGPGNNGGDGFACARHLSNEGVRTTVVVLGDPARIGGDAAINFEIIKRIGLTIEHRPDGTLKTDTNPGVVVDALLGTGLDRAVGGAFARGIGSINALGDGGAVVIAADIPSGLDADSGRALGVCVRAHKTVTFAGITPGLLEIGAQEFVGELVVAPIGCPVALLQEHGRRLDRPLPGAEGGARG